jgi:hypothetical protein
MIIRNMILKDIHEDKDTAYLWLNNKICAMKLKNKFKIINIYTE